MTDSKHTWEAKGSYVFKGGECIAVCDTDNASTAEYARRARLMAAAPDLLDVLVELMAVLRKDAPGTPMNNHRFDGLGIKAYDAIAKAGG